MAKQQLVPVKVPPRKQAWSKKVHHAKTPGRPSPEYTGVFPDDFLRVLLFVTGYYNSDESIKMEDDAAGHGRDDGNV